MVLAGKVFTLKEEVEPDTIATKLRDFNSKDEYEFQDQTLTLIKEVRDLTLTSDSLKGVFSMDTVLILNQRGKEVATPKTIVAPFVFSRYGDRNMLTVLEKKERANNIANALSKLLFIGVGGIVEARISSEVLRQYHEKNFEDAKIIFFDDVDIPNVGKLSLYGSELANSTLYTEYLSHGKIWYIVIKSKSYGYVVGITRTAVVTVFSALDEKELMDFVQNEIYPLIE